MKIASHFVRSVEEVFSIIDENSIEQAVKL
jgi:hypothetical protein